MVKNFIKTSDEDTAKLLKKEGFQLLSESNGLYTFINKDTTKMNFNQKKVVYTNTVCL